MSESGHAPGRAFIGQDGQLHLNGAPIVSSTQTATVTTDASTFTVSHDFDLGDGPHLVLVTMTILALDADGETWGEDPEQIQVLQDFPDLYQLSFDGSNYVGRSSSTRYEPAGTSVQVVQYCAVPTPRYLRVTAGITPDFGSTVYSGSNHPTAQVRFDLSYT